MALTASETYMHHRIHASRLFSGVWVVSVVAPGSRIVHIPGEFATHEQAVQAAKDCIDRGMEQGLAREAR